MAKDVYRSRVYEAEESLTIRPLRQVFTSVEVAQDFVNSAYAQVSYLRRRTGNTPPTVKTFPGEFRAFARVYENAIYLPAGRRGRWAWCDAVLLHELAHCLLPSGPPAHGVHFVRTFVDVVRVVLGDEPATKLTSRLVALKVPADLAEWARRIRAHVRWDQAHEADENGYFAVRGAYVANGRYLFGRAFYSALEDAVKFVDPANETIPVDEIAYWPRGG